MSLRAQPQVERAGQRMLGGTPLGPIELLIVQASPFCNIDCSYCYLPDRKRRDRIAPRTFSALVDRLCAAPWLLADELTLCWHAGEPMAVPAAYYESTLFPLALRLQQRTRLVHSFQTNGTLLDADWIGLLSRHAARIGVSVDGPAFLHDACRRNRAGKGTHAQTMRGIRLLQEAGLPFNAIAVVTQATLDHADAFHDFFADAGIGRVGLNVEETELSNARSSLDGLPEARYRAFLERLFQRSLDERRVVFREFSHLRGSIGHGIDTEATPGQLTRPFGIVTCDHGGRLYTYSPELAGAASDRYGDFVIGNVLHDDIETMLESPALAAMALDIRSGIERCRGSCDFFGLCRGGTPSNKFFENGSFDSSETTYCRFSRKATTQAALSVLERHAGLA